MSPSSTPKASNKACNVFYYVYIFSMRFLSGVFSKRSSDVAPALCNPKPIPDLISDCNNLAMLAPTLTEPAVDHILDFILQQTHDYGAIQYWACCAIRKTLPFASENAQEIAYMRLNEVKEIAIKEQNASLAYAATGDSQWLKYKPSLH